MRKIAAKYLFAKVTYISKSGKQTSWRLPQLQVKMQEGDHLFLSDTLGFERMLTAKTACCVSLAIAHHNGIAEYDVVGTTRHDHCRYKNRTGYQYTDVVVEAEEVLC